MADELNGFDFKELSKNQQTIKDYNTQQVANNVNNIIEDGDILEMEAEQAMDEGSGNSFWQCFGIEMAIIGFLMSAYSVYRAWDEMNEYYHTKMLPIPKMMVDRGTNAIGESCYIYYDCVS